MQRGTIQVDLIWVQESAHRRPNHFKMRAPACLQRLLPITRRWVQLLAGARQYIRQFLRRNRSCSAGGKSSSGLSETFSRRWEKYTVGIDRGENVTGAPAQPLSLRKRPHSSVACHLPVGSLSEGRGQLRTQLPQDMPGGHQKERWSCQELNK